MKVRYAIGALLALVGTVGEAEAQRRKPPVVSKAAGLQGNPGQFFGPDSYPPAALRAGEQGRVIARLEVDVDGHVTECTVSQSSGSISLDAKTCEIALARVIFTPALDDGGAPIASSYTLPVRWVLPTDADDQPVEITTAKSADVLNEMALTLDGKGLVERCVVTQASTVPQVDPCTRYPVGLRVNGGATRNGKPVRARIVTRYSVQTTYDP